MKLGFESGGRRLEVVVERVDGEVVGGLLEVGRDGTAWTSGRKPMRQVRYLTSRSLSLPVF